MSIHLPTAWHKRSFDRFLQDRLPQLLAERLPLTSYQVYSTGRHTCRISIALASASGDIEVEYANLPQPDEDGLFETEGEPKVVTPLASTEELDIAEIRCVGEQLYDYVKGRLGQSPPDLPWDVELARAWLPLDTWLGDFFQGTTERFSTVHKLEATNWLARQTHLRRLMVPDREQVIAAGQMGRVCPFETPEGPNIGHILTVAVGAEIREGKLVILDERPASGLALSASMIPFLEHNDANRLLLGANMMRQWLAQPDPEPALVQTGNEPDAPGFWAGRNLLTAFVSWGADTTFDGIAVSESAARRFSAPHPLEPGDKLSNRHGTKGVVSRILPDDEMPHLPDGTPVDLAFSFSGLHVRMNFGQIREAVMSRIARTEGRPAIVPPFQAPGEDELCRRLSQAGLPESGMETLTLGGGGPRLHRPSTVGWIYWGRTSHLARGKLRVAVAGTQAQGELETYALRDLGAYENLREALHTRSVRRQGAGDLAARVASGPVEQAEPPTPMFSALVRRLEVAGIEVAIEANKLLFRLRPPGGDALKLAHPVPHPWLRERQIAEIGVHQPGDEYDARSPWYPRGTGAWPVDEYALLVEANDRVARMLNSQMPEKVTRGAVAQLEARVRAFFDALLTRRHLYFFERQLFSGRTVLAPGGELRLDQVGLPDEMAWTLFGPLVIRELTQAGGSPPNTKEMVKSRVAQAAQALDEVMARSWVILNRAPTLTPTALLAFHPLRQPDRVIRLHPLACEILSADFDGDQAAIFVPVTEGAQREAGERLSVASHLARDPALLRALLPPPEALWGLASLGLSEEGRREIAQMTGVQVAAPKGLITQTTLGEAMERVLAREGIDETLSVLERLMRRGFEVAKASGASMSPFIGASLARPPEPVEDDLELWAAYNEELSEQIVSGTDYQDVDLGPQRIAVNIRARGRDHLRALLGPSIVVGYADGDSLVVRHNRVQGLTPEEMYACAVGARQGLTQSHVRMERMVRDVRARSQPKGFTVLARARRAKRPGIVFARAAANEEIDPLLDVDSRLLVGLPV